MWLPPGYRASNIAASAAAATPTTPLDGLSGLTGAWSFSRKLLSAYAGAFYRDDGSGVADILYDQSGNSRNFTENSVGPQVSTFGPNSRACADFDAATDFLETAGNNLGVFIDNNAAFIIVSGVFDTLTNNDASSFRNHGMIGDASGFQGIYGKSGGSVIAFNFDGSTDDDTASISAGIGYVFTLRHEGGTLFMGVNGTEGAGVASGNTSTLTGIFRLGRAFNTSATFLDGKVLEAAVFDTVPNGTLRSALVTDFKNYAGF